MKPRVFIGSSKERLDVAYAIQENIEEYTEVTVWDQGVFEISKTVIVNLIDIISSFDYAVFIMTGDDAAKIKSKDYLIARDNVIFETGLFIGRLGLERCFMVVPRNIQDLHLPSDIAGITLAQFEENRQDGNLRAALGPACSKIKGRIQSIGQNKIENNRPTSKGEYVHENENDCINIIQSWMGSRSSTSNCHAMRYDDVDQELQLKPGSARKYLEIAAKHWGYTPLRRGDNTILFQSQGYY